MTPTPWQPRILTTRQKRAWGYGLAFVLIVLLVIFRALHPGFDSWWEAQVKAREDAQQRQKTLCRLLSLCSKFGDARAACATAGNYKMCIDIKMGADAMDSYLCTNDGAVSGQPNDMPTAFECLWLR